MTLKISRRNLFAATSAFTVTSLIIPRFGMASKYLDKNLSLYNVHTGEGFKGNYMENGVLIPGAMEEIKMLLRDHRNGQVHDISPDLMHLLNQLQNDSPVPGFSTFDVVSGYRSPATNAMLRRKSKGVAKNSYHMKGCAIDIKLPKNHIRDFRNLACSYQKGGVGYYPKSGFVHVDIRKKPAYWGAV